jgi:hypothetical protein
VSKPSIGGIGAAIVDLLLRPGTFFSRSERAIQGVGAWVVSAVLGLTMVAVSYERFRRSIGPMWSPLWLYGMLLFGLIIVGPLRWQIGVALFRARLRWSHAPSLDRDRSAAIFGFSEMVADVPLLLWVVVDRTLFPVRPGISPTILLATAWSQFVAYQAVRGVSAVSPWRARVWFLVVPAIFYVWQYRGSL